MGKKVKITPFLLRTGLYNDSHEITALIKDGKVRVGDRIVHTTGFEFRPSTEHVFVDGKPVEPRKEQHYYMFNKPIGVICQKNDAKGRPTVWDWLKKNSPLEENVIQALVTVGRLDINTEGLLLLTTDGELVNKVIQPEFKIPKEYHCIVKGEVEEEMLEPIRKGMKVSIKTPEGRENVNTLPAQATLIQKGPTKSTLSISIIEGKKRQVRAMLEAIGHPALQLRREKIGKLELGNLKTGTVRRLSKEEVRQYVLKS
jgi:pseudouridine synthase